MLRVQLWIWRLRFFHIPHQNDTLNWRSHASFNIPHLIFQAQFQCGRGACHLNQARSRYIERCLRFTAASWMSHCHFRFWIQWRYPQQEPILSHLETNQSKIHIQQHLCVRYAACFVSSFFRTWCGCHDVVGCFCGQAHMAPTSFWGAKSVMSACVFQVSICKANHRQFTEQTFLSPVCIPCLKGPMHCQCSGMDSSMLNCETDKKNQFAFIQSDQVLVFAVLLVIWTEIPSSSWQETLCLSGFKTCPWSVYSIPSLSQAWSNNLPKPSHCHLICRTIPLSHLWRPSQVVQRWPACFAVATCDLPRWIFSIWIRGMVVRIQWICVPLLVSRT